MAGSSPRRRSCAGAAPMARWRCRRGVPRRARGDRAVGARGRLGCCGQVCTQAKAWSDAFAQRVRLAVNLSTRQLYDEAPLEGVGEVLQESGLEA